MTTFLLIRHGESAANRADVFAGNYDAELLENGFNQARCSAKYIKETFKVTRVFASDLHRAYHTGKCIADEFGLEANKSAKLREISAGEWEGVSFEEITLFLIMFPFWQLPMRETITNIITL